MKKKILFGLIIGLFIIIGTTGCGDKKAISAKDFKSKMEAQEFQVVDTLDQIPDKTIIKQSYIAVSHDSGYKIEYYEFSDEKEASHFYEQNKKIFQTTKTNGSSESEVNVGNHSKFKMNSDKKYKVISRVANTALYIDVNSKYKEVVNTILKDLGY